MKIYGVGRQLLAGVKKFHREASAYVKVDAELSESFSGVWLRNEN